MSKVTPPASLPGASKPAVPAVKPGVPGGVVIRPSSNGGSSMKPPIAVAGGTGRSNRIGAIQVGRWACPRRLIRPSWMSSAI